MCTLIFSWNLRVRFDNCLNWMQLLRHCLHSLRKPQTLQISRVPVHLLSRYLLKNVVKLVLWVSKLLNL